MKKERRKFFFYKLKKLKQKAKNNYFREIRAKKRSAPKWTSNKIGNAKKGHIKTGFAKVVAP